MRLDVGCGTSPTGDVNCDLFIEDINNHRNSKAPIHEDKFKIDTKKTLNFIKCDAYYLPFKGKAFDEVFSADLIEHVADPYKLFIEMARVSSNKLIIQCPHKWGDAFESSKSWHSRVWLKQHHVNSFSFNWFKKAAPLCGFVVNQEEITRWLNLPNDYLPWMRVPGSIRIVCFRT